MTAKDESKSQLVLSSKLSAHEAETVLAQYQEASGQDLEVDASSVELLSTPCIQIMLAAAKSWKSAGKSLKITEPSVAFSEAVARLAIEFDDLQATGASS